ncbi:unnamed protein product [Closterium sp. NIES-53]
MAPHSSFLHTVVTNPSFESTAASALVAELVDFAAACRLDCATSLVAESGSDCPPFVRGECVFGTDVLEERQEDFECLAALYIISRLCCLPPRETQMQHTSRPCALTLRQLRGVDFFQTYCPTPKVTTLQGSLHEEIWLLRPPGFTGSFPTGTQWSLCRPVYDLCQAPREWHDTLRMTLAALGFAPSTADPSLFLCTDTSVPPFYVLVYVDNLVFATADTEALALVKSELHKRHTCTDLGPSALWLSVLLATFHSSAYWPLALSSTFGRVPSWHATLRLGDTDQAAKRVLRCLCSTSGMGLVLGGRGPVVLTGHADASWVDELATQRSSQVYTSSLGSGSVSWRSTRSSSVLSSSCEAEIYTGAMAAQELRWLTYLLTDLGGHDCLVSGAQTGARMKHVALRYFLAREMQQRGQICLAYVATQANTADIFTKALQRLPASALVNISACDRW